MASSANKEQCTFTGVDYVVESLGEILRKLREMSPLYEDFLKGQSVKCFHHRPVCHLHGLLNRLSLYQLRSHGTGRHSRAAAKGAKLEKVYFP